MTLAAFNIHKNLVEKEGFDPSSDEYYTEVDKRMMDEFPHKFETAKKPTQKVAAAGRADVSSNSKNKLNYRLLKYRWLKNLTYP